MKTIPLTPSKGLGLREGNRAEPVGIWKARNFIYEHSAEEISLTQVAKAVNISPNYLSEKFKQVIGINLSITLPGHDLTRRAFFCMTPACALAKSPSRSDFSRWLNLTAFSKGWPGHLQRSIAWQIRT